MPTTYSKPQYQCYAFTDPEQIAQIYQALGLTEEDQQALSVAEDKRAQLELLFGSNIVNWVSDAEQNITTETAADDFADKLHIVTFPDNHIELLSLTPSLDDIAVPMEMELDEEVPRFKSRLLLGEGNCSYAVALLKKHQRDCPGLGATMTVTTYEDEATLRRTYPETFDANVAYLVEQGVTLIHGVDASRITEHPELNGKKFDAIHFNFPHDGQSYKTGSLKRMLGAFFQAAAQLQTEGGQVYMGLPKPPNALKKDPKLGTASNYYYKVMLYDIYDNTRHAGYRLDRKREFGPKRYEAYKHVQTHRAASANVARFAVEYVFVHTGLNAEQILQLDLTRPVKPYFYQGKHIIPELETDGDSTDYYSVPLTWKITLPEDTDVNPLIVTLNLRLRQLIKKCSQAITIEDEDLYRFVLDLESIGYYLRSTTTRVDYTYPNHIAWKKFSYHWMYRCQNEVFCLEVEENKSDILFRLFALIGIIVKKATQVPPFLLQKALETLFYLSGTLTDRAMPLAETILKSTDVSWESKVLAAATYLRHAESIELLLEQIGYDPRLDATLCHMLRWTELSAYVLNKDHHAAFKKITDWRLIYELLMSTTWNVLSDASEVDLPDIAYKHIAAYHQKEKDNQELSDRDEITKGMVANPLVFSMCIIRNVITNKPEETVGVGLTMCSDIALPAQSVRTNADGNKFVQRNLQEKHQLPSYLRLAKLYHDGQNGCQQSYRMAQVYYKLAAKAGSGDALKAMAELFDAGKVDVLCDHFALTKSLYGKLAAKPKAEPENSKKTRAIGIACRALIEISNGELDRAKFYLESALKLDPNSPSTLFNFAIYALLERDITTAKAYLNRIEKGKHRLKVRLLKFISYLKKGIINEAFIIHFLQSVPMEDPFSLVAFYLHLILDANGMPDLARYCRRCLLACYPGHYAARQIEAIPDAEPPPFELTFKCLANEEEWKAKRQEMRYELHAQRGAIIYLYDESLCYFTQDIDNMKAIDDREILIEVGKMIAFIEQNNENLMGELNDCMRKIMARITILYRDSAAMAFFKKDAKPLPPAENASRKRLAHTGEPKAAKPS